MTYEEILNKINFVELKENATIHERLENENAYMTYFLVKNNSMPANFDFEQMGVGCILANLCEQVIKRLDK